MHLLHISIIKVNATTPFQANRLPQSGYHVNSISLKPPRSFRRKTNSFIKSGHLGIQTHIPLSGFLISAPVVYEVAAMSLHDVRSLRQGRTHLRTRYSQHNQGTAATDPRITSNQICTNSP